MSATLPPMKLTTSTTLLNKAMVAHILTSEERMAALGNQVLALNMVLGSFSQRLIGLEREVAELRQAGTITAPPPPQPTGNDATVTVMVDGSYRAPETEE